MPDMTTFPMVRVRALSQEPVRGEGRYVLYWMVACRRTADSFAIDRALAWARELDRPLVVLEALRCDYPYASDRFHRFVFEGMADNARAFAKAGVTYLPFVEREKGGGKGLLAALASEACVVVTDDYPTYFLPHMLAAAARALPVRLEAVDGNGLMPLQAAGRVFPRAYGFRRFLQRELASHLEAQPSAEPFAGSPRSPAPALPKGVGRYRFATQEELDAPSWIASLPIDHRVGPIGERGGSEAAIARLKAFLDQDLKRYAEERSDPDHEVDSRLSGYLHFGHLSTHRILRELASREGWTAAKLGKSVTGQREGYWGMSPGAEAFLDQIVTWRELGYVHCAHNPDHASYHAIPSWARASLQKHARDPRPHLYTREELEAGRTYDDVWNAAQRQLVEEGRIHNAIRMIWGKRVLEWTRTPEEAHALLLELNDRYAIDGRDPNTISGVGWCFGLFDRAWGPERPIFGTVRYMSSDAAKKKLRMKQWLLRHGPQRSLIH
jgi:deoxyribodipyrimidine photo-lyase